MLVRSLVGSFCSLIFYYLFMKTFDCAMSMGGTRAVAYVPVCELGDLDCAPSFFSELAWYVIGGELVGFGVNKVVAPIGGVFLSDFEHRFLGGLSAEFGFEPFVTKWVAWEPIGGTRSPYYSEGYAVLEFNAE